MNKRLLYTFANTGLLPKDVVEAAAEGQHLLRARCPVHETARSPWSFVLTTDRWYCNSEKCHENYGLNLEGLVVALADRYAPPGSFPGSGWMPAFKPAHRWLECNAVRLREHFAEWPTAKTATPGSGGRSQPFGCPRARAIASLVVPDPYFVSRGFSPDTLRRYRIGQPVRGKGVFAQRKGHAIVPLPDLDRPDWCAGYVARNPYGAKGNRWRASHGLAASQSLFNYNPAKAANARTGRLLFVEGVPDALRCVEAGHPEVLAALGSSLLPAQVERLTSFRLDEVVVIADKDEAGDQFARQVRERLAGRAGVVKVVRCPDPFKDVGEMSTPAAREFLSEALSEATAARSGIGRPAGLREASGSPAGFGSGRP